jgi:peptide/nickel transport system ATP-binding protein
MANNDDYILEIEGLYTNFYTYQGVVKALDGIDLKIRKGETIGLVGETGCGKSVTARSILRLVQSPGKIERGSVYFQMPPDVRAKKEELWTSINKKEDELAAKISAIRKSEGDESANLKPLLAELNDWPGGKKGFLNGKKEVHGELYDLRKELLSTISRYDLLNKSESYMQKIRGKYISIIFQEPMSSLNPVFTSGEQISETFLLHERKELADQVLKNIDERVAFLKSYKKMKKVFEEEAVCFDCDTVMGEDGICPECGGKKAKMVPKSDSLYCSGCGTAVSEDATVCPSCGGSFEAIHARGMQRFVLNRYRGLFKTMRKDPQATSLTVARWTPFLRRYEKLAVAEAMKRSKEMLEMVRIPDPVNVLTSYPFELSGGMQQRVAIAMGLACSPTLLIADEPTTALDVTVQAQILKLMKDLQDKIDTSILLITHNLGVVAETCDRVGVMYAGVMAEIAPVREIFKEPLHPYTQGLVNSIPKLHETQARLDTIEGNVPNLVRPPSGCRFHPRCEYAMDICREKKPPMVEVRPGHLVTCHLYTGGEN